MQSGEVYIVSIHVPSDSVGAGFSVVLVALVVVVECSVVAEWVVVLELVVFVELLVEALLVVCNVVVEVLLVLVVVVKVDFVPVSTVIRRVCVKVAIEGTIDVDVVSDAFVVVSRPQLVTHPPTTEV